MKAIILAWWKWERLLPITKEVPKPLIQVGWITLIQRIINQIPKEISEILIVVWYLWANIVGSLWSNLNNRKITYITQEKDKLGTLWALYSCKDNFDQNILIISSDNIYSDIDIAKVANSPNSILIYKEHISKLIGSPLLNYKNTILSEQINNIEHSSRYINTWLYNFWPNILKETPIFLPWSHELSIPHTLINLLKKQKHEFIFTNYWFSVWTHQELDYVKIFHE